MRIYPWALSVIVSSAAFGESLLDKRAWRNISDPLIMSATFERNYGKLPKKGAQADSQKLWSGDYWPLNKGNINYRWNSPRPRGFNLDSPAKERALQMTNEQLSWLAPTEKFDLLMGRYDYPLVKWVDDNAADMNADNWEGICHGWNPAAMNHNEPTPKTLANPDGIMVPFGSSDIKAVLSHYYAKVHKVDSTHQMGRRCGWEDNWDEDNCTHDMNAGAFHIVLTNQVGISNKSFVADIDREDEVWNHSVMSYQMWEYYEDWPAYNSAEGTFRRMKVEVEVVYLFEQPKNLWTTVIGTSSQKSVKKYYQYFLDLDRKDNVIGGEWISWERPDFLWTMARAEKFREDYSRLSELLND